MLPESQKSFIASLASEYGDRLRRFLFRRARNASDVPDLAQEVFLRLMRVDQHEIIRSPEAYLFTVAGHVAHQHTLSINKAPKVVDITEVFPELQADAAQDPLEQFETSQKISVLRQALDRLPVKLSTTLLLHRFAGYSIQEIADELGIARITAAKYLAQALLHCRNYANGQK